jgi:hypothetical protein
MKNFKTIFNFCWVFLFCCFQSMAQETGERVSICNNLGITSLNIERSGSETRIIRVKAGKVSVNDQVLDLNENIYEFSKTDKSIELIQKFEDGEKQSLEFNGETFIYTNRGTVTLVNDENVDSLSPEDLLGVIVLANILKEAEVHFDDAEVNFESPMKASTKYRLCDHVEVTGGQSRSVSQQRCTDASNKFLRLHKDCVSYGSCDTTCLWGDHLCFSTALFLCNGSTCFFN